jgi:hypothetical protein
LEKKKMVEKIKEVSSVPTTNDYAVLVTVKVLPQTSELLVYLKEEDTNAVLYKIEGAQDEAFVDAEELKAETSLAKNGSASKTVNVSWLFVRVLHKAAVAGVQGKTSCIISGSGERNLDENTPLLIAAGGGPYALSDDVLFAHDAEGSLDVQVYTKVKEINVGYFSGTIRVAFTIGCSTTHDTHGCIYKNGVATEGEGNNGGGFYEYVFDLAFAKNDLLQLYVFNTSAGYPVKFKNFRILGKFPIPVVPAITL